MSGAQRRLTRAALAKAVDAITILEASLTRVDPFDPARTYTPEELEPYDALSDRFIRAVEVAIRCMRSLERLEFAENSETLRDLLHRMEKLDVVSDAGLWLEMRDIRNRMVHDDLPEQRAAMFADILGPFGGELLRFRGQVLARSV